MRRVILSILLILVLASSLASSASAFSITFKNTTDRTLVYRLHWLACDWWDFPEEVGMAGGELASGKDSIMGVDYKPGPYTISWSNLSSSSTKFYKEYEITVEKDNCMLISTPEVQPWVIPKK